MILHLETLIKSHNILEHILVMWFISTYLVPENNFYFEHSNKYGSWAANFTKKNLIFFTPSSPPPSPPPVDPSLLYKKIYNKKKLTFITML